MATPNVGILTTAGKALIDKVNSGQAKISFSKVVFSSMDNSQLSDTQVKALTAISPQEVVVSPPETTLDTTSGETRIRATGTNKQLADGVYVKTYGVFAKDDTGNEVLYGVTVSPNPNYFPAYDGVTPQAVTYSYKTVIQETSNITMTNSNDVYVSQEDLTEAIQKNTSKFLEIPDDTDLFSLVANDAQSHYYLCSSNASVKTLKNCPVTTAFSLELYPANIPQSVASNGVAEWAYTQMLLQPFNSSTIWIASTNSDGDGNISNTSWVQVANMSDVTTAINAATASFVANKYPNTPWMTIADTPSDYLGYRFYNQSLFITGRLTVGSSTANKLGSIPSSIVSQIDFPYSAITAEHYGFTVGYLHSNMGLSTQATLNSLASVAILLQPTGDIVIDPLMTSNISGLEVAGTYHQDVYAVLPLI